MKNTTNYITVDSLGARQLHNGESAKPGEAAVAINLREREQCLQAVGKCQRISSLKADEQILLLDEMSDGTSLIITHSGRTLTIHGMIADGKFTLIDSTIATISSDIVGATAVGNFVVVTTSNSSVVLRRNSNLTYTVLDTDRAIPSIIFSEIDYATHTQAIQSYSFAEPYSHWTAPLRAVDVNGYSSVVKSAIRSLTTVIESQGRLYRPVMVRYAVRLWDDSYLWISAPVMLGKGCLSFDRQSASVTQANAFIGIGESAVTLRSYRIGITVAKTVASEWRQLVKSIDILTSDDVDVINLNSAVNYRCSTTQTGTRQYFFEFAPTTFSSAHVAESLLASKEWKVVASSANLDKMDEGEFVSMGTAKALSSVISGFSTSYLKSRALSPLSISQSDCSIIHHCISHRSTAKSMLQHAGCLILGGISSQCHVAWDASQYVAGWTRGESIATIEITFATPFGPKTISKVTSLPATPTDITPIVCVPLVGASHIRIAFKNAVESFYWQSELMPLPGGSMSCAVSNNLAANDFTTSPLPILLTNREVTIDRGDEIEVSLVGNPLVVQRRHCVAGCQITQLAIAGKPIYSGGFGRYPIYVFTTAGIYAILQNSNGSYGESRIIDSRRILQGTNAVNGRQNIYFISSEHTVCALSGATVKVLLRDSPAVSLAWDDYFEELWVLRSDNDTTVIMESGRYFTRRIHGVKSLHNFPHQSLAVTYYQNTIFLIGNETDSDTDVQWLSHPIALQKVTVNPPRAVIWNVTADDLSLSLRMLGERGASCHGFLVSGVNIKGKVGAPLRIPIISPSFRTFRLSAEGTLPAGTLLYATNMQL